MKENMCKIPVSATMSRQTDGTYRMVDAVYKEIPADCIAQFIIRAFGGVPTANKINEQAEKGYIER